MKKSNYIKKDYYQTITDKLINAIEKADANNWVMPWTGATGNPTRSTGEYYRGVNHLVLMIEAEEKGFSNPNWFTFKQAKDLGAQVKKGEKGSPVVYYKSLKIDSDGKPGTVDAKGNYVNKEGQYTIPLLKGYTVFNADQIENLPAKYEVKPPVLNEIERDAKAEKLISATGAKITHKVGSRAYYSPSEDCITLPMAEQFKTKEGYYSTLFHELIHWTKGDERTGRTKKSGAQAYAFEELVAEIGTSFICNKLQISSKEQLKQNASYLKSWLQHLKNDNKFIFKAAAAASAAAEFIYSTEISIKETVAA